MTRRRSERGPLSWLRLSSSRSAWPSPTSPSAFYVRQGALDRAVSILERGRTACRSSDMPVVWMQVAATLGYAHLLGGRHAEGLSLLEEAEEQAGTLQFMYIRALAIAWLAEAHLLAGRRDEAKRHARRALMVARAQKARGDEAWSHRLQAEIAFREGPRRWAESESAYLRALALADELGMRPLAARCHLGLGHLCRRAGKPTTAERHFARARALCRRLEMDQRLALRGVSRSIGHKRR